MGITQDNVEKLRTSWGSNNDGTGSGLDADTLDGIDSTGFVAVTGDTMTGALTLSNSGPIIKFNDTTASAHDFWLHANSDQFYILTDRDNDGAWDGSYPLRLENSTSKGYIYNNEVLTTASTTGPFVLKTGDTMTGGLVLNNGTTDTPEIMFSDTVNSTRSYMDQSAERWRVFQSYRGAAASTSFSINASSKEATFYGNSVAIAPASGNANMEIGGSAGANTPYIDFHSGSTYTDHDYRLIASGGNGTNAQGKMSFYGESTFYLPTNRTNGFRTYATFTDPTTSFIANNMTINTSGSTATGGDISNYGLYIDYNSTVTGGDTTDEHRNYGILVDMDINGDSDVNTGIDIRLNANHSAGQISTLTAASFRATADQNNAAGTVSSMYGIYAQSYTDNVNSSASTSYGGYFKSWTSSVGGAIISATGMYAEVEGNNDTIANAYGVRSYIDVNAGAITNGYLFLGQYQGTTTNVRRGIQVNGESENHFDAALGIGTYVGGTLAGKPSIALGDSDTGFYQNGDGVIQYMNNNQGIYYTNTTGIWMNNSKKFSSYSSSDYDKIRVWDNSNYTIGMHSGMSYGGLNDFAMTFTMSNTANRGWVWRHTGHSQSQGAMSLTTTGVLTVPTIDGATISGGTY